MALVPFAKSGALQILAPGVGDDQATLLLEMASSVIRGSLGWNVDQEVDAVYSQTVPTGNMLEAIVLPARNVTAVADVLVDGAVLPTSYYRLQTDAGVIYLTSPAYRSVVVTYTAGWAREPADTAPGILRTVCLDYAMRLVANPTGVQAYTIGGTSESFSRDLADLADSDHRLDPWRVNL